MLCLACLSSCTAVGAPYLALIWKWVENWSSGGGQGYWVDSQVPMTDPGGLESLTKRCLRIVKLTSQGMFSPPNLDSM